MVCEHACGSTTGCARSGSLWNKAFVKGAFSRPSFQHFLRGGYKRDLHAFQGRKRHHGRFGAPEKEKGGGGAGGSNCRRVGPGAMPLWGMLYADDAEVVSQSPEQLRQIIGVIVVVCAAFGSTVSAAKTEIISLRVKGMPESTAIFSVEAAGKCTTK